MTEKITLRYCRDCGEQTIHISKKEYDEVDNFSHIKHKCLVCGNVITKIIDHNELVIQKSKGLNCVNCGNIIHREPHIIDDTMGMSGMIYYTCSRKCADEYLAVR